MLHNCKWDASRPFVCTAAYRGVISAINFNLITSAQTLLRQEQTLNPGGGGIDAYNQLLARQGEVEENDRALEEQGLVTLPDPRIVGGMLKVISASLNDELKEHAQQVIFPLSGKKGYNPFEVGDTVEMTLHRQISRTPRDLTARMKMEAKAMNKSEEVILEGLRRQQRNSADYLIGNRELILEIIHAMNFDNVDTLDAESIWDRLPVMIRFRLLAAADNGLYYASDREAQRYIVNNRLESKSNVGLIDGERRVLRKEINEFLMNPRNDREIAEALTGGATIPVLQPLAPSAEDLARAAAKAA